MLSFCFANEKNDIIPKYPDKEVPIPSPHAPIAQAYRKKRCKAWAAGQIWKPCKMCTSTRRKKTWKMPAGCWPFFNRLWHGMWLRKSSKNSIHSRIKQLLFYWRCDKKSAEIPKFRHFDMNKSGLSPPSSPPQSAKHQSLAHADGFMQKNPAKQSTWLEFLVAAMWFEHMTLRVWKIKIGNKRHGWRGGCGAVEGGRFVWIKHIYEYSKLIEISTVWKSRIVQNEVYIREKRLSFNIKL